MSKRRVWSDDKKQELVAETKVEGVSVASVARKHRVSASQLTQWIRDPRFNGDSTRPEFAEVEVEQTVPPVNERSKLTRFQRLNLTHRLWCKAPRRAALT